MRFKNIVFLMIAGSFFATGYAQTTKKNKPTTKKKAETESIYTYIDSIPMPDKFKKASVVIMGHYEKMKIIAPGVRFKFPGKTEEQTSPHYLMDSKHITRYLMQDINAVEKFATYYFSESENGDKQIRVIKKSGEVIAVDLSKAIKVKESFSSGVFELSYSKYKKIAIAGLEVGDMIEFAGHDIFVAINTQNASKKVSHSTSGAQQFLAQQDYGIYSSLNGSGVGAGFLLAVVSTVVFYPHFLSVKNPTFKRTEGVSVPEYTIHLDKKYPVVRQVYDVETPSKALPLEYSLLNNATAPEMKNPDELTQSMRIESDTNNAMPDEYFYYQNNNNPAVKYTFNLKSFEKFNMHFNNVNGKGFNDAAAETLTKKLVTGKWKANAITKMFNFDKEEGRKIRKKTDEDKLKYFYYYYKKNFALSVYLLSKGEELILEPSMASAKFFQLFCTRYGIPYEVVMWSPRGIGETKNITSGDKLRWGILAHPDGKDVYLTDFDALSEYGIPHQNMYGSEVYYVDPNNEYAVRSDVFEPENDRNNLIVNTTATLNEEGTGLKLKSKYTIEGELKNSNYYLVANRADFYKQYETLLGAESKEDEVKYLDLYYYSSDFKAKEKQELEEDRLNGEIEKNFNERIANKYEDYLSGQYGKETKYGKVDVDSKGLTTLKSKNPEEIGFTIDFGMEGAVNNVGNGAIVMDLGRLMSEQIEFKGLEDRTRINAIDVNYSKSYDYTVSLTLPAGFKAANLTDFEANIENDVASFVSTIKEENGVVIFHCIKKYKKVHAAFSEWNKMTEPMDAAAKMFQKRLLLEKTN